MQDDGPSRKKGRPRRTWMEVVLIDPRSAIYLRIWLRIDWNGEQ